MLQSTTPSLSQTIWPRWASRQFLSLPIVQTLLPVTFGYSLSSETVVMRQLRRGKSLWQRSLTRSHKSTSMGPSRSCWNGTSALQPEESTSKGTRVSCVYYQRHQSWLAKELGFGLLCWGFMGVQEEIHWERGQNSLNRVYYQKLMLGSCKMVEKQSEAFHRLLTHFFQV